MINSQFTDFLTSGQFLPLPPQPAYTRKFNTAVTPEGYYFSLVVASINRSEEIEQLLCSLTQCNPLKFEVIIVDQNEDKRLDEIIASYSERMNIEHFYFREKNASMARNFGALKSTGKWIAFPDDDCCYTSETLNTAEKLMDTFNFDLLLGNIHDFNHRPWNNYFDDTFIKGPLLLQQIMREPTLFIRKTRYMELSGFNEKFGPGTPYNSGEGIELGFRALKSMLPIYFSRTVHILHSKTRKDENYTERSYRYAIGTGKAMLCHYPLLAIFDLAKNLALLAPRVLFRPKNKLLFLNCVKGLLVAFFVREPGK